MLELSFEQMLEESFVRPTDFDLATYWEQSTTSVPLRSQLNETFGFLTLFRREARQSDRDETDLFQLIASHVGVAVENSLLFQDVNEKIKALPFSMISISI